MAVTKKVFLTPSVFFAFVDRNHPKHSQADAYFRFFTREQYQLFTTISSVIRTYNDIRKHMSYSIAKDFLRAAFTGNIQILYPDEPTTRATLKLLLSDTQYEISYEQALINVMADRQQISQICSFEYSRFYFGINLFTLPY
jgi:predicted nucleic acid-binding protein